MKKKVISWKNSRTRLPIWNTLTLWLLMEKLNATPTAYWIVGSIWVLLCITCIVSMAQQEEIDIFEPVEKDKPNQTWEERIAEVQRKQSK